jgi:hypothetical protein
MSVAIDIFERMFEYEEMPQPAASASSRALARAETVQNLQERIRGMQATKLQSNSIPTHPAIADLLPGGGLQEGATYSIAGSGSLLMSVVVAKPPTRASDSQVARLSARLRQRGSTLIVLGTWPHSDAMLSVNHSDWSGIGDGHGYLEARKATITVSTRSGARPRSARVWLPDPSEQFRQVSPFARANTHSESMEATG